MSNLQDILFIIAAFITATITALYYQLRARRKQFLTSFYIDVLTVLFIGALLVIILLFIIFAIQKGLIHND